MAAKRSSHRLQTQELTKLVRRFVVDKDQGSTKFDDLALHILRQQAEHLPGYSRLFKHRGVNLQQLQNWQDAPAIPTAAFKQQTLTLLPPERVFRSSGTSQGAERRSEHHHGNLDLYRLIVEHSLPAALLGAPLTERPRASILSLIAPVQQVSDSSLGFMVDWAMTRCGNSDSTYAFGRDGNLDLGIALDWLGQAQARSQARDSNERPVILATGLALWSLLDAIDRREMTHKRSPWPSGAVVMETGGFKTHRFALSREHMLERFEELTLLPRNRIVREYGMTELTSQAYASTLFGESSEWFTVPPWVRVRALDPASMQELEPSPNRTDAPNSSGLLAFFDLGNVASAASIVTEDLGIVSPDRRSFQLLGRAPDAELRGCSLATEALL